MSIEVSILLSVVTAATAALVAVSSYKRNNAKDTSDRAREMATVITKLDGIGGGVTEIKHDIRNIKEESRENRDMIIRLEGRVCSLEYQRRRNNPQ